MGARPRQGPQQLLLHQICQWSLRLCRRPHLLAAHIPFSSPESVRRTIITHVCCCWVLFSLCVLLEGFLQTISFVEVVHAAAGLVPSGVMLALMQWGGRTHFLLAILRQIPEVQGLPSVFITFMSWSMTEVIRYPHYALSCIGISLSWLTYLRYTAFIILYPIGIAPGEMWLMYQALPFIKERNLYADFFGRLSISYYHFVLAVLICYPVLWLKLYLHLFRQRGSKLGKHQTKKKV
ncbi:Protein tyrosine phosphatase-like protein, PTPLA [Musa troglodytarum]|uniref:Very-long-chain (3R)-3-hydroxyacyl-CoA dehydratase n=1 Tax=Musa troglodytarum TaxID=320322 RepID=A0A9E7JQW5_9LILI|nr:Protein tyrosine phosphatase-like protein, PTPLA [Musa troglodytarum]